MSLHKDSYKDAGKVVTIVRGRYKDQNYRIEDYWDKVTGQSWMDADGNPAALNYAVRGATEGLPIDDEVVYGKMNGLGYLVHVSELP